LTFLSSFYLMLLSTCILLCAHKHGWMDGWMEVRSENSQTPPQRYLLIEIASAAQSRCLNKSDNLAASPHRTLNTCKGVIRCRLLVDCDKEEILNELQSSMTDERMDGWTEFLYMSH